MEQLYHQTNRIIQEIQNDFQNLTSNQPISVGLAEIEDHIHVKLTAASANCDRLDVLVFKVPASQRPQSRLRIDQIKYDIRHLQNSFRMYQQKQKKCQQDAADRVQLLNHRFTSNQEPSIINIDYALEHNNSLNNAHKGVDEMLNTGSNVLYSLRSQRDIVKGAQKRVVDIGNTLGLSNHTMKLIERRFTEDKYVLFGGMIVTVIIIVLIIWFFVS